MKMTSDMGNGDVVTAKREVSDSNSPSILDKPGSPLPTVTASNREAKNRLTFSIDSLVGKNALDDRRELPITADGKLSHRNCKSSSSPSPPAKRHCPQSVHQSQFESAILSKTPPANGPDSAAIADQRIIRHSAFMPPAISSASSASGFVPPVSLPCPGPGTRLCWDLASVESTSGVWKDAVSASAMYQAAAAAALYTGYHPWYGPAAPITPGELAKKQQLLLQHEQQSMAFAESVVRSDPRHFQGQQNHGPAPGVATSTSDHQSQTFWHHHIAELLRQNGGHPVHHSRLYGGPDTGHAATSFLFSGCRKPKRIRTAFSPNQLMELEAAFEKNQYVVGNERKELARRLALTETQVKVWFQNRRTKAKRMKNEDPSGTPRAASATSSPSSSTTKTSTTTVAPYRQTEADGIVVKAGHENGGADNTLEISASNSSKSQDDRAPSADSSSALDDQDHSYNEEEPNGADFLSSDEHSN